MCSRVGMGVVITQKEFKEVEGRSFQKSNEFGSAVRVIVGRDPKSKCVVVIVVTAVVSVAVVSVASSLVSFQKGGRETRCNKFI